MDEIKVNLESLNEEERKTLMKIIEKANAPKSKAWKPNNGEMYYCLPSLHGVDNFRWHNDAYDQYAFLLGNCFQTREEAAFEAERLKVLTQWKRLSIESGEADNPWDGKRAHWYACYDMQKKFISYCNNRFRKHDGVFFATERDVRNAVETIGEENVKKYILGIKGEEACAGIHRIQTQY